MHMLANIFSASLTADAIVQPALSGVLKRKYAAVCTKPFPFETRLLNANAYECEAMLQAQSLGLLLSAILST